MRRRLPLFAFISLALLSILLALFSQRSWSDARELNPLLASGSPTPDNADGAGLCHYQIPLCSIDGSTEKGFRVSQMLERSLKKAWNDIDGKRVTASEASRRETVKSLGGRKGSFDIIGIEEEITPVGDNRVVRATVRIESVSPPPGHPKEIVYTQKNGITPCILKADEKDDSRCTPQMVSDIMPLIIAHDKDCHHGNSCSH